MFNPFKVQLSCDHSIASEEREQFLEFVNSQLLVIGCDRVWREGSPVYFSNHFISFSRGRHHLMAGVDGGVFSFSPFSGQIDYEYRSTTLGVVMTVFALFGLLVFMLNAPDAGFFPLLFIPFLTFIVLVNWAVIRHRQKRFLQQLELEFGRMKKVFSQSSAASGQ